MSKTTAKNGIVLINGYNFSTFATAYQAEHNMGLVDVTGFSDGGQNFIPGLPSAKLTIDMLWDSTATTGTHAILSPMGNGVVTIIPEGYALGNPSISMPFTQGNYSPKGEPAGAIQLGSLEFAGYGATFRGIENGWALAHGTITNTATGTGFIDPSAGAVTAVCGGTLHIWTPCAADTYVVVIEHSSSAGSGYAPLITFVADGSTRTVERQVIASGTINKYRRIVATRTGSAGNDFGFSVHFWHA
jgi:hypothetical protein